MILSLCVQAKRRKTDMADFEKVLNELYCCEDVKLSKKEKEIIKFLNEVGSVDIYDLMETMDYKPSSFYKHIDILEVLGFIAYSDDETMIELTQLGKQYLLTGKKEHKQNKKFLKFLESLSDEELEDLRKTFEELSIKEEIKTEESVDDTKEVA